SDRTVMAGRFIDASGFERVSLNDHAKLATFSSKFLGMSHVGTKRAARLRGWAVRRWQFFGGFISSRKVRGLVAPILVGLFPIAVTLRIIRGNWVSVPFKDEWWHPGGQIVSFFHGTLRFVDLFQQHNDSRTLFPRLYSLLMTALTGRWDVKDA